MSENRSTTKEYTLFEEAYEWFNRFLFNGELPRVLITLQRKNKTYGYFHAAKFKGRADEVTIDEIALNPDHFGRDDREILSTLVHEMCHVWRQCNGDAPKHHYHDKQWAKKMKSVGLYPSDTGEEGGKETGQKVSHYIISDGEYEKAYSILAKGGFKLTWQSIPNPPAEAKARNKVKFLCGSCSTKAWGKPTLRLYCAECTDLDQKPSEMLPEGGRDEEEEQTNKAD